MKFPGKPTEWIDNRTLYISIPFTWDLPTVKRRISQRGFDFDLVMVGGPAVNLMPEFFMGLDFVSVGKDMPGMLQIVNPLATKTTTGCVRHCDFCAVWRTEGKLKELAEWPDLPIIIDNNLLAASQRHFDRVIDRLIKWEWADFNQGLDSRLLTNYHAERIAQIKKPMVRLALDGFSYVDDWKSALEILLKAGIKNRNIRSYALIGFNSDPSEAWRRCEFIESYGVLALPQWFHRLDAMEKNIVTDDQKNIGWNDYERRRIMQWFYKHKKAVKYN